MSCPFDVGDHVERHGLCGRVIRRVSGSGGTILFVNLDGPAGTVRWSCSGVSACSKGLAATASTPAQCVADTLDGDRCSRDAKPGSALCWQHKSLA